MSAVVMEIDIRPFSPPLTPVVTQLHSSPFAPIETELSNWMGLRGNMVLNHPLISMIERNPDKLFKMFELYSNFVCDFTEYVCKLFIALRDEAMKSTIYDNLIDEMGINAQQEDLWRHQHGELYLQFISSLRKLSRYRTTSLYAQTDALKVRSSEISARFYSAHAAIISDGCDLQSFSAFSTIECWVSELYGHWRNALMTIDGHELLDMRTIDLHSVCDTKHSAIIDELIMAKLCESDNKSAYSIKRGLLRGMHASEQLFTDIYKELL